MKAWSARVRRFVRTRRRLFAALFAGLAVWAGLTALRPPEPPAVPALVTVRDVTGGQLLTADDVAVRPLPAEALPGAFLTEPAQAIGRPVTVSLPSGAVLLPATVVTRASLAAPGMAVLPVTLADSAAGLVEVGDRLDLLGTEEDGAARVASAARVVAVLSAGADGSPLSPTRNSGPIVLIELRPDALPRVATAAARGPLGFGFR